MIEFDWKQGLFVARSRVPKKRSGEGRQSPELDIRSIAKIFIQWNLIPINMAIKFSLWTGSLFRERNSKEREGKGGERACRQTFEAAIPPSCNYLAEHLSVRSLSVNQFRAWVTFGKINGKWVVFCSVSKQSEMDRQPNCRFSLFPLPSSPLDQRLKCTR